MLLIYRRVRLVSFVLLSLLIGFVTMTTTKADQSSPSIQERVYSNIEPVVLEQGRPIERELAAGEVHSYEIKLMASQFLHIMVEQKGIDVVVILIDPDSKKLVEVDSPNGTKGPEPLLFIAELTSSYRVEVRSLEKTAPTGRYEIKIAQLRTAIPEDKDRIAANRALAEAEALRTRGSAESLRNSIEKYEQALTAFLATEERNGEVFILTRSSSFYTVDKFANEIIRHSKQP
ncbi:MAG: hypothetical protein AB1489_13095 [Acidobacteriota bacterium]